MPAGLQYPVIGSFPQWEARPFSDEPIDPVTMGYIPLGRRVRSSMLLFMSFSSIT